MTLALYGKPRRRQGGLLLLGLLAVLAAMLAGVATFTSAFAHHPELRVTRVCNDVTVHFDYVGPGTQVYTIETRASNGGSWTQVAQFNASGNVQDVYPAITHTVPTTQQYRASLNNGEVRTVDLSVYGVVDCDMTISQGQCAPTGAPAWVFHFVASGTDAGSGGTLTVGYKINNGPTQYTQQDENGNGAKANWHVTIPFGGTGNTITIVSAVASGGPVWNGVNGAAGATVSSTACSTPTVPKLKVIKNVVNSDGSDGTDPKDFGFTVDRVGESNTGVTPTSFTLDDDDNATRSNTQVVTLVPVSNGSDEYLITETNDDDGDWELGSITCTGAVSLSDTDTGDGNIRVTVNNSSDVICTFVNKKPSQPDLTANKTNNVSGAITVPGSFLWKIEVRNAGTANARFGFGDVIFRDNLPTNNGLSYSGLTRTNVGMSGTEFNDFSCSLSSATIICDPDFFETVDIGPGQGFDITVTATPTSAGTYANPNGVCKVDPDGEVSESNENNNTCADTVIGRNPQVIDPTVSKSAHTPAISGGFAYWDIKVDQPSSGAAAINGLVIVDSQTDVVIDDDGAATCSVNPAGTITCNVPAADVTIVVKRPINASTLSDGTLCLGGHIQNSLVSAALPTGAPITITGGGANSPISITVPADMTACSGTVSIEKGNATLVGDVLQWPITVTNTYPVAKHIIAYDPDSSLLAGTETCTNVLAENPADYYDCEVGANSTATFTLTTVYPGHTDVCVPLDVTNTAYIAASTTAGSSGNLGSDSGTYHEDAMPPADCMTVAKASVAPHNGGWTITFGNTGPSAEVTLTDTLVPNGTGATLLTMEANGNPVCGSPSLSFPCTVTVPTGGLTIAVTSTVVLATCEDQTVTNTVAATLGTAPITNTTPNGATQTIKGDPAECEGTVIVKKVNLGPDTASIQDDLFTYTLSADGSIVGGGTISGDDLDGDSSTETAGKVYTADETDPTAQGYKSLGMRYGRADEGVSCPAWDEGKDEIVAEEPGYLSTGGTVVICLYNEPFGTLVINKVDGINGATGPAWAFTVTGLPAFDIDGGSLDSTPGADQGTPSTQSLIPLGASLNVTEDAARSMEQCATANTYYTQVIAPADKVIDTPGETVAWTFTNLPCATLGTGGIIIEKYNDLNGNGIIDAGEPVLPGWSFTTTGGGIPAGNQVRSTNASGQVTEYVSGFDAGTVLNTTEAVQAGWKLTGVYLDGVLQGTSLSNNITVIGGQTRVIKFLNYLDPGQIVVTKTIRNNAFPNGANGGAGWTFVLNGCGVGPITATTNSSGVATFSNLPPAINCQYTITEPQVAPWVADDAVQEAAPGAGQSVTVNFTNSFFETCTNCRTVETPTPTATPEQPTATPTTPVDEETPTPTNTPEPAPTNPISQVEGERTPGPGGTPIAPSTGAGAGTAGGMNVLLVLAGLVAISGGALVLTFSRKRDR